MRFVLVLVQFLDPSSLFHSSPWRVIVDNLKLQYGWGRNGEKKFLRSRQGIPVCCPIKYHSVGQTKLNLTYVINGSRQLSRIERGAVPIAAGRKKTK